MADDKLPKLRSVHVLVLELGEALHKLRADLGDAAKRRAYLRTRAEVEELAQRLYLESISGEIPTEISVLPEIGWDGRPVRR